MNNKNKMNSNSIRNIIIAWLIVSMLLFIYFGTQSYGILRPIQKRAQKKAV